MIRKANIISMGCSKTLVDSEKLMQQLVRNGFNVSFEKDGNFDVVIVNTCGFIADAKEESVEMIMDKVAGKARGEIKQLIVIGCLTQRYREEINNEIPEIDAVFGVDEPEKVIRFLNGKWSKSYDWDRFQTTPPHYAWLKIAEGCNRKCSFCAIPEIRGGQKSLTIEKLVKEAKNLTENGVKELLLVAQDLTAYGLDIYRKQALADLVSELDSIPDLKWIRLHYAYPAAFPEEVIDLMSKSQKVCNYLDIPFQHASDKMLKAMKRGHSSSDNLSLIEKLRSRVPDIALRTTLITGFPGETEKDFNELLDFVRKSRFERLGVFTYSEEEGTDAAMLKDNLPQKIKEERAAQIMSLQEDISFEKNRTLIGKELNVIVDSIEGENYIGRTEFDSPEVDNEVIIKSLKPLMPGDFVKVKITDAFPFDLEAKAI